MNLIATKKQTHIGKVRSRMEKQIHEVSELLEWSHEQYCNHQFEQYCLFVEKLCSVCSTAARDQLMYSPHFRGMWNNQWAIRNEYDFIQYARECVFGVSYITEEYLFIHNHLRLLEDEAFMNLYSNVVELVCKEELKEREVCYV